MRFLAILLVCSTSALAEDKPLPLEKQVDVAVEKGVKYLMTKQNTDGSFGKKAPIATTGLVIEALLAAGEKFGKGDRGKAISKAADWLVTKQTATGLFETKIRQGMASMYAHGIATKALADVCRAKLKAETKKKYARTLEKAVQLILKAQQTPKDKRSAGGWRYRPNSRDSDLSVTTWHFSALHAAKQAGVKVPQEAIDRAVEFTLRCHKQGWFSYMPFASYKKPVMTAAGATILYLAGKADRQEFKDAAANLAKRLPHLRESWAVYGSPYIARALFASGKKGQAVAREKYIPSLLAAQAKTGEWRDRMSGGWDAEIGTARIILALTIERAHRKPKKPAEKKD